MDRIKKTGNRIRPYLAAAVTMTAIAMLTGCGENAYADQINTAELAEVTGAALVSDGFYTIEVPSYTDTEGKTMALDTENGVYQPGCALPVSVSDHSQGQQFLVTRRAEGIYTIQNANTDENIRIRTGLAEVSSGSLGEVTSRSGDTVEVELWKIVETTGGDIMIVPYMLETSLFEQITVESFGNGADFARPWIFTTTQVGIREKDITLEYDETEYTGELITPSVSITKAGKRLVENTDYVVVYENNRDIGTAKVRVSGIGEYQGTCVTEFEITPIDIKNGGAAIMSESESAKLIKTDDTSTDITADDISPDTASDENGNGSTDNGEENAADESITTFVYTGSALAPQVTVTYKGTTLTEGVDYTYEFKNNVNPGTALVHVSGMGIYRGSFDGEFVIGGVDEEIDQSKTYTFAPKSHGTDRLAVKDGGITTGVTFNTSADDGDEKEKFRFFANEDGTYRIISVKSGFCLEDIAGSLRLAAYGNGISQNWNLEKNSDGSYTIMNAGTKQVLTAAANTKDDGEGRAVTTVECGTDAVPEETDDMHFYLVETEGVDAFAEGYYTALYSGSTGYSIAYGTRNGKTGLYIQDESVAQAISLVYSGDGWYRVIIGTDDKVLTSDEAGNLSEAVWSGTDAQLWRFEQSDGTPVTAEMTGIPEDANAIADDGTPGFSVENARFTARLVNKRGIALTAPVDSIDRSVNFTADEFLQAVANVYKMAHDNHFTYGSSTTAIPCADGLISCDRLIARAVYDLGLTDQEQGGITVGTIAPYLRRYGFETFTDMSTVQPGDIIICNYNDGSVAHSFVVVSYNASDGTCTKYDLGSQSRIDAVQPMATLFDEWSDKSPAYGVRNPYTKAPAYVVTGTLASDDESQLWIFEK